MADLLRIVTLSKGGRPVVVKDLSYQQGSYAAERDTFKFTPAAPQQQTSRSGRRFGGATVVGESHENAQVSWDAIITATTSAQAEINIESMLAEIHATAKGRLLEWRPDGASYSSFMRVAGPGTWDPSYRWAEWVGTNTLKVAVSFPVAPLVEWAPMVIVDDFQADSFADYTISSLNNLIITSALRSTSNTQRTGLHTARGYRYRDVQVTMRVRIGADNTTAWAYRAIARASGLDDYLYAQITQAGTLSVGKNVGGVATTYLSATGISLPANTVGFLRVRAVGDTVVAEWFTSAPSLVSAPSTTTAVQTLSGGDETTFADGYAGWRLVPNTTNGGTDFFIDDFTVEPYAYPALTLPATIQLGGDIPGNAPAKTDVSVTMDSDVLVNFASIGWSSRPGTPLSGALVPFGVLESSATTSVSGLATNATASARGGSDVRDGAVAGLNTYSASWTVDPHTLVADGFVDEQIDLEVWGRLLIGAGNVNPTAILKALPDSGTGAFRYTHEYGQLGKLLVKPSAGNAYRFCRLGTLTLPVAPLDPSAWLLMLEIQLDTGSTGVIGVDYLVVQPRRSRALSPTGVPADGSYPSFMSGGGLERRTIFWDLAGSVSTPPGSPYPHHGLGGSLLTMPPGPTDLLVKLCSDVPDNPTVVAGDEQLAHPAGVSVAVTPRSYLLRSG